MLLGQVQRLILKGKKIKWWKERQIEETQNELIKVKIGQILESTEYSEEDKKDTAQELFNIIDKNQIKTKGLKIPEHLICPITDDLMEEPVIISSGFTYEKSEI